MIVRLYNQPTRVPSNEDDHKRFHWVSIFAGYSSLWLFQCRRSTAFIHPNLPLPHGVARRSLLMYLIHAGYVDFRATYIRRAWCLHTFHVARGLSNITHLYLSLTWKSSIFFKSTSRSNTTNIAIKTIDVVQNTRWSGTSPVYPLS